MNQLCKVCGEPAAGFHFGAFTCEGCKSFFGRTYNNISAIAVCKNSGDCVINKKNRTACKSCRLRKCLLVGMSKSGSRYGRRSNWFKIHCLLQDQQTQPGTDGDARGGTNFEQLARLHQMQARQTYQDKTNPCIKTASMSPHSAELPFAFAATANIHNNNSTPTSTQHHHMHYLSAAKFLNGVTDFSHIAAGCAGAYKTESRLSDTPSDTDASSVSGEDFKSSSNTPISQFASQSESGGTITNNADERIRRRKQFLKICRSHSEPLHNPFAPFSIALTHLHLPPNTLHSHILPADTMKEEVKYFSESTSSAAAVMQEEPIDLSLKTRLSSHPPSSCTPSPKPQLRDGADGSTEETFLNVIQKPAPLDLTMVRIETLPT